jgi:hypothetical protein
MNLPLETLGLPDRRCWGHGAVDSETDQTAADTTAGRVTRAAARMLIAQSRRVNTDRRIASVTIAAAADAGWRPAPGLRTTHAEASR